MFGYFPASRTDPGATCRGGTVFTCLSHDVVAHETTHSILDGLHRRYIEPSGPRRAGLSRGVRRYRALFQPFSLPEAVRHQISRTRGDLGK